MPSLSTVTLALGTAELLGSCTVPVIVDKIYDRMGAMMANKGYGTPGKLQLWLISLFMRFKKDRNGAWAAL